MDLWWDDAMDAIVKSLERRGMLSNTVIIYFNDHGVRGKSSSYESGARIPAFMWRQGGFGGGHVSNDLVSTVDVAPTVLELAGVDVSPYKDELDGVSLVQYMKGLPDGEDPNLMPAVGGAVRSHLYIEAPYQRAVVQAGSGWKFSASRFPGGVVPGREKNLLHYAAQGHPESSWHGNALFNLVEDPDEGNNVVDEPQNQAVVEALRQSLTGFVKSTPGFFADLKATIEATARIVWLEAARVPLEMRQLGDLVNAAKLTLVSSSVKLSSVAHKPATTPSPSSTASDAAGHAVAVVDVSCAFWGVCPGYNAQQADHVLMWSLWKLTGHGDGDGASREQVGIGCRRADGISQVSMYGLIPGSEYDLELRLAYGSGASIGVGTRLRLSVPSRTSDGGSGGDDTVVGTELLEAAFGGHAFEAPEGTLGAVLAGDLRCEWEWMKNWQGGAHDSYEESRGDSGGGIGNGALRRGINGVATTARTESSSGSSSNGAGVSAEAVNRVAGGGEGGSSVQVEIGAVAWVMGAFGLAAMLVVGCLVARVKRRSRSAEGVHGKTGTLVVQ